MASDTAHVLALEQRLRDGIMQQLQGVVLNGPEDVAQHRRALCSAAAALRCRLPARACLCMLPLATNTTPV
jgi:hypothetical protein